MDARNEEITPEIGTVTPSDQVVTEASPPGAQESLVLALDSFITLIGLFKTEAALAVSALPMFIALNVTRLPVYLLTWISFAIFVAAVVYSLTGNVLLTAGTFFVLHLVLTFLLERMLRKTREACSLPETQKGVAMAVASVKERFK